MLLYTKDRCMDAYIYENIFMYRPKRYVNKTEDSTFFNYLRFYMMFMLILYLYLLKYLTISCYIYSTYISHVCTSISMYIHGYTRTKYSNWKRCQTVWRNENRLFMFLCKETKVFFVIQTSTMFCGNNYHLCLKTYGDWTKNIVKLNPMCFLLIKYHVHIN